MNATNADGTFKDLEGLDTLDQQLEQSKNYKTRDIKYFFNESQDTTQGKKTRGCKTCQ
jgi:hypothetical protein